MGVVTLALFVIGHHESLSLEEGRTMTRKWSHRLRGGGDGEIQAIQGTTGNQVRLPSI